MENKTGIILFVDSEEEICRHYKHMEDNNGIVEWGCNVPIKAYELKLPFYAYMYITRGEGIKYRCRVRSKRSKSNLISPDDETNVPEYYCSQKLITWLKFDKIEKLDRIVYLNEFKLLKGGQSSPRPSIGGYRGIIDDIEVESVPFNKLIDCPSKDIIIPLEDDYLEEDVELHFAEHPQQLREMKNILTNKLLEIKDEPDGEDKQECIDEVDKTIELISRFISQKEKESIAKI
jgi:hypothetical protein